MDATSGVSQDVDRFAQKHPIAVFLILTYAISWACWLLASKAGTVVLYVKIFTFATHFRVGSLFSWVGNFGPGLAALFLVGANEGRQGLRKLWARVKDGRVGVGWYLFALLSPGAIVSSALLPYAVIRGSAHLVINPVQWLAEVLLNLPLAPFWEEIGWRGYLLPRMEKTRSGLWASIILGMVWSIWHVPLRVHTRPPGIPAYEFLLVFCAYITALAIPLTWIYNRTNGVLIPVILFHGALNATGHQILDPSVATDGIRPFLWATGLAWVAALIILAIAGPDLTCNRERTPPRTGFGPTSTSRSVGEGKEPGTTVPKSSSTRGSAAG